ncbi:hypothetical protein M404DRAFT_11567, partial [Pisolithus tinctorius Marx 270]
RTFELYKLAQQVRKERTLRRLELSEVPDAILAGDPSSMDGADTEPLTSEVPDATSADDPSPVDEANTEPPTSEVPGTTPADNPSPMDEADTEPPTSEVPGVTLGDDPISVDGADTKPFTSSRHDALGGVGAPVGLHHGHIKETSSRLGSTVERPRFPTPPPHSMSKRPRSPTPPIGLNGMAKRMTSSHPMKEMKPSHTVSGMSSHGPIAKPHTVKGPRLRLEQDSIHTAQDTGTDNSNCTESTDSSAQLREVDMEGSQAIRTFTFRFPMPREIFMGAMATLRLAGQGRTHGANTSPHGEHIPDLNDRPSGSLQQDTGSNAQQNESTSNGTVIPMLSPEAPQDLNDRFSSISSTPGPLPLPCPSPPSSLLLTFTDQDQLQPLEERILHMQIARSVHHPGPPNSLGEDGGPGPVSSILRNQHYPISDDGRAPRPHNELDPDPNDGPSGRLPHDVGSNAQRNESTSIDF